MALPTIRDPPRVLSSWKEIACYMGKGVRTVQRWEQQLGLPVRRPPSAPRNIVSAVPQELDVWLSGRWVPRTRELNLPALPIPFRSQQNHPAVQVRIELLHKHQQLMDELRICIQAIGQECESLASQCNGSGNPKKADS